MYTKSIIASFLALLMYTTASAQVIKVPQNAKTDFSERFKDATGMDWTNSVTFYTCNFKQKGVASKAYYHLDGYWNYTERIIAAKKVPSEVKDSFEKSKYRSWSLKSLVYVENNNNVNLYRYEVKKGIEKMYVFFDKEGKIVKENLSL